MNQLEAYGTAYRLALKNAEVWLDLAKEAFSREHYGQAYSQAVYANEEIVKAYISWGVSQEYIPPSDEAVTAVYRYHVDKGMMSLNFHFEVIFQEAMRAGLIEFEDALRAVITSSMEEVVEALREHAREMEEGRKAGIYVMRPVKKDGTYTVSSPADFPRTRAENLLELVDLFHKSVKYLLEAVESDRETREWFESTVAELDWWLND